MLMSSRSQFHRQRIHDTPPLDGELDLRARLAHDHLHELIEVHLVRGLSVDGQHDVARLDPRLVRGRARQRRDDPQRLARVLLNLDAHAAETPHDLLLEVGHVVRPDHVAELVQLLQVAVAELHRQHADGDFHTAAGGVQHAVERHLQVQVIHVVLLGNVVELLVDHRQEIRLQIGVLELGEAVDRLGRLGQHLDRVEPAARDLAIVGLGPVGLVEPHDGRADHLGVHALGEVLPASPRPRRRGWWWACWPRSWACSLPRT